MTKCDSKCDKKLQNVTNVIQSVTKCDKITKCDSKDVRVTKGEEHPGKRVWSMASRATEGR